MGGPSLCNLTSLANRTNVTRPSGNDPSPPLEVRIRGAQGWQGIESVQESQDAGVMELDLERRPKLEVQVRREAFGVARLARASNHLSTPDRMADGDALAREVHEDRVVAAAGRLRASDHDHPSVALRVP